MKMERLKWPEMPLILERSGTRPLTTMIPLKLFLDIVPSSSADVTRAFRGCFGAGSVYVSFRFVSKLSKTSNAVEMPSFIF